MGEYVGMPAATRRQARRWCGVAVGHKARYAAGTREQSSSSLPHPVAVARRHSPVALLLRLALLPPPLRRRLFGARGWGRHRQHHRPRAGRLGRVATCVHAPHA
eukprot:273212-Prymnesium_polylepis.2